jgi:hypothetical protein
MEIRVSLEPSLYNQTPMGTNNGRSFATNRVVEMRTFLVTLVRQFDFSLPENGQEVVRTRSMGTMSPVVVGEENKGPQLPLKITALRDE